MNIAIKKEINKEYVDAVLLYEDQIDNKSFAELDSFINLAFLYWEFATEEFAFNIPNNIPDEWSLIGGERFLKIIDMGLEKYPKSLELHFWKKYLPYRLFNFDFSENDCNQLVKMYSDDNSIVPYFFLYLFDKEKYIEERNRLLEICTSLPNAKNIYIKSIIS